MKILQKISFYTAITILTSVASFLLLPVMTKYLSTEDYGILSIFNALVRFIVPLLSLGSLNFLMTKIISTTKQEFANYIKSFISITVISTIIFTVFGTSTAFIWGSLFGLPLWIVTLLPFTALMVSVFEGVIGIAMFQNHLKDYALITLSKFFIEIGVSVFLVVAVGLNWIGRLNGLLFALFITLFIGYNYLKKNGLLFGKYHRVKTIELIKYGTPLIFMNLSIVIMNLSDRFYIESMIGLSETGVYSIAAVVGGIELIFVNASIAVFRPMIYEHIKENKGTLKIQLLNVFILLFTFFMLSLFKDFLFMLFIDEKYVEAKFYVDAISLGFLFWGICNFYLSFFIYLKKTRVNALTSIFGVVLNLSLNYFLIKKHGVIGAAYATAITYFILSIIIYTLYLTVFKNEKTV